MSFLEIVTKLFGNKSQKDMREVKPYVDKINEVYATLAGLSHDELRAKTEEVKTQIAEYVRPQKEEIARLKASIESLPIEKRESIYKKIDDLEKEVKTRYEEVLEEVLPLVYAIVKDTARRFAENEQVVVTANDFDRNLAADPRFDFVSIDGDKAVYLNHWTAGGNEVTWDMVHYDVQLIGGVVLHKGKIAEMATGEGKTLVATLPVFLNALTHEGVHVVTVNDYLAKRDSEWNGPIYMFHGLSVDCIDKYRPNSDERRKAYLCDITFGTNNEFGFDYLRDNMATSPMDLVQRSHNYAIVDEVDSVLIDDARTPLIISGPVPKGEDQLFDEYKHRVEELVRRQQTLVTGYLNEAKKKMASDDKKVQEEGELALFRAFKGLPKFTPLIKFLSEPGIKVRLQKTEEFYMQEQEKNMHIATDPLYFVIDEKTKQIELTDKGADELASKTEDPNFFVLPDVGSEIADIEKNETLTAEERQIAKDEAFNQYAIKSERVHTVNQLLKAYTLFVKDVDYIVTEDMQVKIVDEQTGRVMEGRRWSDGLHQAVEAKENAKVEAATQTFATITLQNYFRMYNKLSGMTGTAETEAGEFWNIYKLDVVVIPTNRPIARIDMNDRIYRTKREKYNAVIDEVVKMKEAGRPVLVGTTSVDISELLSKMLRMRGIDHQVLNAKLHQREAEIVALAGRPGTVTIATNMAGRGTDIKLTPEVKAAGGLAIIGTERHESRRVDRQLRGRAGRQGDPGSSVFYVSLEDELMRLFGSERIAGVMDKMGFEEGEMIEHNMISSSIERAQKKVEENNFGIRKHLIEYDDVMNLQRNSIYEQRRHALMGERLGVDITNMIYTEAAAIIREGRDSMFEEVEMAILHSFAMEAPFTAEEYARGRDEKLTEQLAEAALDLFKRKMDAIAMIVNPVIKRVYEEKASQYKNILIPITDGKRTYQLLVNLEDAYNNEGKEVVRSFEKQTLLYVIDDEWKEHLRQLDELRHSVQTASYEQKDPLLIYKIESNTLFRQMKGEYTRRAISILMRGQVVTRDPQEVRQAQAPQRQDMSKYRTQKDQVISRTQMPQAGSVSTTGGVQTAMSAANGQDTRRQQVTQPIHVDKKVRPNDPCPCGSGKKYKQCHGKATL